jgi:hypothetical protein
MPNDYEAGGVLPTTAEALYRLSEISPRHPSIEQTFDALGRGFSVMQINCDRRLAYEISPQPDVLPKT